MQCTGFHHFIKLRFDSVDMVIQRTTVGFDLRLTWATDKTKATALAFQVGPTTDKTGFLIGQMCKIDLQNPLACRRSGRENLQNQTGPVKDFNVPFLL